MAWTKNGKFCNEEVGVADPQSNIWSSELHNGFCCIYDNYLVFFSTQVEWLKLNGNNRTQMNYSVVVDGTTYYWINVSGNYVSNDYTFVKPAIFDSSIVADDLRYMIENASGLSNYHYYIDVNGNEEYFEWRSATSGGVVFDIKKQVTRPSSNYDHLPVLAYDLRQISNPSVTNMYYSYWGQNMGTVYTLSYDDVYIVWSNITPTDDSNPRGYDVSLESSISDGYTICADIRAYWDAQGGVENLYVGVNGKAQQVKKLYVGVNGKAQEVKAIYVGVNGKAQKVF